MRALNITEILAMLPHRYPMVLIDRVIELTPGEKITAIKNVTINEPYFTGHFPQNPIMPGVMIVEAMGQAGGVLVIAGLSEEERPDAVYFMGFDHVRFRKPVIPGDQLKLEVLMLKKRSKVMKMSAVATVDDKIVAEAEFLATFGDAE